MNIISWNVNGIRAAIQKDFTNQIIQLNPDILCIQETKAQDDQTIESLSHLNDYFLFTSSAQRKGYSGTALLSKIKPLNVSYGISIQEHDTEGRVICAEFDNFYMVVVYVPNSGSELLRLEYRKQWDLDFFNYLKDLEKKKPVIVCGDFNVAHSPIDLAHPKANYDKSAGYTQIEIDGMDRFTNGGFIDTYRYFYPKQEKAYTWWSYRAGARAKNVGWRIDYFLISRELSPLLKDAKIFPHVFGSDHCPIGIEIF